MNLTIELTPSQEARLSAAAKRSGLDPARLVRKLVEEHLPAAPNFDEDDLDAKLRRWQEQDATRLMLEVPTQSLFAQWAAEDARMTDAEREAEDRLWADLEQRLTEKSRVVQLRRLS
jgi:hypothetical protein